jgi:two-component system, NarL family, sensor histidine kinase UhpB
MFGSSHSRRWRACDGSARDLRLPILDDLGLVSAIEWLAADHSERGIRADCHVSGGVRRLRAEVELALSRITQEALRNVEKHAGAAEAVVKVWFAPEKVIVVVRDNGCGVTDIGPQEELVRSGRLGLAGMHERADLNGRTADHHQSAQEGDSGGDRLPSR